MPAHRAPFAAPSPQKSKKPQPSTSPDGKHSHELSGARAARVARFLIETGLEADKVTAKAFGANRPRFRNDSEIQRVLNNRVELIILPVEE